MILTAAGLFGLLIFAGAQTPYQGTAPATQTQKKSCYVDKNNNGSCDLRESGQCQGNPVRQGLRQGPRNGQGIGRPGQGVGRNGQGRGLGPCGRGRR